MTIKSRNKIILTIAIISTLSLLFFLITLTVAKITNQITPPAFYIRTFFSNFKLPLFDYHFLAAFLSISAFAVYVPVISLTCYKNFENTPSLEILFFQAFLIGILCEEVRFFMTLFSFHKSYSFILLVIGKVVIAGRILVPLSLFFSFAFNSVEDRQNAERNFIILLFVSMATGLLFPLETQSTTSTCTVLWSFRKIFSILRFTIFLSTLVILLLNRFYKKLNEYGLIAVSYSIMCSGYFLLCLSDNYLAFIVSTIAFYFGSFLYLKSIHKADLI